jgi:flagellar biosynthesis protein FlhG
MANASQTAGLREVLNRAPANVIAITSGKGGVGKTNVAANLAVSLSTMGKNVMLLDADLSLANVDVLLGLQPRFNLSHVVTGETDLSSTILRGPANIRIVPASSGHQSLIDVPVGSQAMIIKAFADLVDQPDVLLVDTAAGISEGVARFVAAAQQVIVVVCDEPASITDAYALIKVFSRHYGISHFRIVTNQTRDDWQGRMLFTKLRKVTDQYLDVVLRHLGNVPHDEWLRKAVQEQRSVADAYPRSASATAFRKIAADIAKGHSKSTPNGNIQFFLERLLSSNTLRAEGSA